MNNWVITLARNNLDLLRQSIKSFKHQDVGDVRVFVVNNGSTDGTAPWLWAHRDIDSIHFNPQKGVSGGWNAALRYIFSLGGAHRVDRALVCNSDAVLRPDTFRHLAAEHAPFVTAIGSGDPRCLDGGGAPRSSARRPHPDFSCFMISRECYETVGPFDEGFAGAFCEDSDYHCRMHTAGIEAYAIDLPFWHIGGGSQTIKRANATERERIARQAMRNRAYFEKKWGFPIPNRENGGTAYYAFFNSTPPRGMDIGDDGGDELVEIEAAPV